MSHKNWSWSFIETNYTIEKGVEGGGKVKSLCHIFLIWLYDGAYLLIVLPSYIDSRLQKELLYRYPTLINKASQFPP